MRVREEARYGPEGMRYSMSGGEEMRYIEKSVFNDAWAAEERVLQWIRSEWEYRATGNGVLSLCALYNRSDR